MDDDSIKFRTPQLDDIPYIISLVQSCEPLIHAYIPYYYWIILQYFRETCVVAEKDEKIVGWCSILPVGPEKYFLHQIATVIELRGNGIGKRLAGHLIAGLKTRAQLFSIELTMKREDAVTFKLFAAIAKNAGMRLLKNPQVIGILEKEDNEDLYAITTREAF